MGGNQRLSGPLRRSLRRRISPFRREAGRRLIVHCSHHKAGTLWLTNVLRALSEEFGLRTQRCGSGPIPEDTDVAVFDHSRHFDRGSLASRQFRGSHLVRDPRDIVVSGYFYHLWTDEAWVKTPRPDLDGRSYQQALQESNRHDGLLQEIRWASRATLAEMAAWNYNQPEFLELRYEELIDDAPSHFGRLFDWYGLSPTAVRQGLRIADEFAFTRQTARQIGDEAERSHLRSGQPGQWAQYLEQEHLDLLDRTTGDLLVRLGYKSS